MTKDEKGVSKSGAGLTIVKNKEILFEQNITLGSYPTINQCELFALNQAAQWLESMRPTEQNIYIFSDSKTTLQKLNKGYTKSKMVLQTSTMLNEISEYSNLHLLKVRAHIGIEGNERADDLAKEGAAETRMGPEPFIPFCYNTKNEEH